MSSKIPISTFSRLTQLTQKALRIYDKKGILVPGIKELTGYRYYTLDQIDIAIKISMLSHLGFNLSDIKEMLSSKDPSEIGKLFEKQIRKTNSQIDGLNKAKEILLKKDLKEVFTMNFEKPVIKKLPELRVISKRVKGTYEKSINILTDELMSAIKKSNAKITGPVILICHDEDYKEKDADIEIAVPISGAMEQGNYKIKKLPAEKVISLVHKGHPSEMAEFLRSYKKVYRFAEENNLTLKLPDRLLFLASGIKNEDYVSEIQYPVK
jgi:effector-binding domain-containing protein